MRYACGACGWPRAEPSIPRTNRKGPPRAPVPTCAFPYPRRGDRNTASVPISAQVPLCRYFGSVVGCRRPPTLLGSPTCDGPDRHRRVCPGTQTSHPQRLANRMGANSRSRCGLRRWAAACRWAGIGPDDHVEARTGRGDHGAGRRPERQPRADNRGVQLRQHPASADRRRPCVEREAPRCGEEEPRRLAGAHRGATP